MPFGDIANRYTLIASCFDLLSKSMPFCCTVFKKKGKFGEPEATIATHNVTVPHISKDFSDSSICCSVAILNVSCGKKVNNGDDVFA